MGLYHSTDLDGISILNPNEEQMEAILASLDSEDAEDASHPDVSLVHDTIGWSLSVFISGIVTLDNLDASEANLRYLDNISREEALLLWMKLAAGSIDSLLEHPWLQRIE